MSSKELMKITLLDAWGEPADFQDVPVKETLAQRRRREITEEKQRPKPVVKRYGQKNFCMKHDSAFDPAYGCLFCQHPEWKHLP